MSNTQQVTIANVSTIARLAAKVRDAEWLNARTRAEVWTYTKATAQTLARLQQYGVADDVRLPVEKVTQLCWEIFKTAKARHAVLKAERSEALAGLPLVEGTEQYA